MDFRGFHFIFLAILFQATASVFAKYAAVTIPTGSLIGIITDGFYLLSLLCLVAQAVVWQQVLFYYPLSIAYPFMSLTNFAILFASALLFHEGITAGNVIGLAIISVGIAMVSDRRG
jgi:multidrug transporter EmrE-like cation transporter